MRLNQHIPFWLVSIMVAANTGCRHHDSVQADIPRPARNQYQSPEEVLALEIALIQAAADCDISKVRDLLEQGADPDGLLGTQARRYQYAHGDRARPLQFPGVSPSPLLACLRPIPHEDRQDGADALWTRQRSKAEIARLLLSAGADPNLRAEHWFGLFPLLLAAEDNNSFAVRILLEAGAFPDMTNEHYGQFDPTTSPSCALGWAVDHEDRIMIELLLDAGAYPLIGGHYYTALERAARIGNPQVLSMVLDPLSNGGDFSDYQNELSKAMTALIRAWPEKDSEFYDEYDRDQFRQTFELLDEYGGTIEYDAIEDDSLFYYASRADERMIDAWLVREIVEHPATGTLTVLCLRDMLDIEDTSNLVAAIALGLDPNAADSEGRTALHHASMENNLEAYVALVRSGADPDIQDRQGKTPIEYAEFFTPKEVETLLQD
ncbi:MAG: ankyrin repeat domain-containing protein [Phycisphaerales bacterium JB063]